MFEKNTHLDDGKLSVPCHNRVVVVSRVTEDQVSSLISFPCVDQSDITSNSWLQNIPATVENTSILFVTGNLDTI